MMNHRKNHAARAGKGGGQQQYNFIRKLTDGLPESQIAAAVELLRENGIELYAAADATMEISSTRCYECADEPGKFVRGDIYVPAADRERAFELLERMGMERYLCRDVVESMELTEIELAEQEMYRRHRRNMAFCLVLIVLAAIYYIARGL